MRTSERDPRVVVEEYSPGWPRAFAAESARLCGLFGLAEPCLQHVGSTSVEGLPAKPIVDILAGGDSLEAIEACIPRIVAGGYRYVEAFNRLIPERRYFENANFHIHAVAHEGPFWMEQLAFRDALRENPALREEYAALKRRLAQEHPFDVAAYTDAKAPFIRSVLRARLQAQRQRLDEEIRGYPTPIPRCDAQFNHLFEQRARIVAVIESLAAREAAGI